jgi:hypothetical protein
MTDDEFDEHFRQIHAASGRRIDQIIMDTFLKTEEAHDEIASLESMWDRSR